MSLKLSDVLKMKQKHRDSKDEAIRQQARDYANSLREREAQRKRDLELELIRKANEKQEALLAEERRKKEEYERKKRPYFKIDKYQRKIPTAGEPMYWGDMMHKESAWIPHGQGQFIINDEALMRGEFHRGDFVQGEIKWSDGTLWNGTLVDHRMNGVGFLTDINGIKKEVMMRNNHITCYKEELQNGIQIQFEEQLYDIYPTDDRKPTATIIDIVSDWTYLCKFHSSVWPQCRKIDFKRNPKFRVLKERPVIYSLQGFGMDSEAGRMYDYRYEPRLHPACLRENAQTDLILQQATADMFAALKAEREMDTAHFGSSVSSKGKSGKSRKGNANKSIDVSSGKKHKLSLREILERNSQIAYGNAPPPPVELEEEEEEEEEGGGGGGGGGNEEEELQNHDATQSGKALRVAFSSEDPQKKAAAEQEGDESSSFSPSEASYSIMSPSSRSSKGGSHKNKLDPPSALDGAGVGTQSASVPVVDGINRKYERTEFQSIFLPPRSVKAPIEATSQVSAAAAKSYHSAIRLPPVQRLVLQFPTRDKRDHLDNLFESRAIGVGAAREEVEAERQAELKKQQWAALIEERRAKQAEEKQRQVAEQQERATQEALAEKRKADQSKKDEAERFKHETEAAVAAELERIEVESRPLSSPVDDKSEGNAISLKINIPPIVT